MGCCCSKEDSDGLHPDEVNERTRLLPDTVRRSTSDPVSAEGGSDPYLKPGSAPQRNDEHQALSDILDRTVRNIVDVSQMDNTLAEQHDYQDRAKRYTDKIQNNPMFQVSQLPAALHMKDVSNVEKILGGQPLPPADYSTMVRNSALCSTAVRSIVVPPRDDLLVHFSVRT